MKTYKNAAVLKEDRLYNAAVRDAILNLHGWSAAWEWRHVRIPDTQLEVDVVVGGETPGREEPRYVGIELKENSLVAALRQAADKLEYFNAVYVVMGSIYLDEPSLKLLCGKAHEVGIVHHGPEGPTIVRAAKLNKSPRIERLDWFLKRRQG